MCRGPRCCPTFVFEASLTGLELARLSRMTGYQTLGICCWLSIAGIPSIHHGAWLISPMPRLQVCTTVPDSSLQCWDCKYASLCPTGLSICWDWKHAQWLLSGLIRAWIASMQHGAWVVSPMLGLHVYTMAPGWSLQCLSCKHAPWCLADHFSVRIAIYNTVSRWSLQCWDFKYAP